MRKALLFGLFLLLTGTFAVAQAVPELMYYQFDGTGTSVPNMASSPVGAANATLMGGMSQGNGNTSVCNGVLIGTGGSSTTDYMDTGWATSLTGSWTIQFWMDSIPSSGTLFYIFGDNTASSLRCFTNGVAGAGNWILRGPINDLLCTGCAPVNGAGTMTTFVYDATAGETRAYLNGTLVNTVAQTAPTISGTGPFKVGAYAGSTGMAAGMIMDEFRIYNRALDSTEIAMNYNACLPLTGPCTGDMFFSEYLEGSSNNKALEIYNPMDTTVDLTQYVMYRFNNGATSASDSLFPQGTLASGDVFVVGNPSADTAITNESDTLHTLTFFNGDDAIMLKNMGTGDTLDIIGVIGVDPGTNWPVGAGATSEFTLVRMPSVNEGETNWTISSTEWLVFAQNTFDSLGAHTMDPCGPPPPPALSFTATNLTVNEGAGSIDVDVVISDPHPTNATTVDVVLNVGASTATGGGTDFTFTSPTTLTFPAGSTTPQTVNIPITDDAIFEGNEVFLLELQNANNSATYGVDSVYITIEDNELPTYPIVDVTPLDTNGVADSLGVSCRLAGIVYGVNLRPTGLQFTLIDATDGISVFSFNPVSGYSVVEGDSVAVRGTIGQFNGLTQIEIDSVEYFSTGHTLKNPTVITGMDETTESDLIKFEVAWLVDPMQWTGMGSGFNVDVTNGTDTLVVRIDADVDAYSQAAPTGYFHVCGIGSQFDSSSPYDSGYQLMPRYWADFKMLQAPAPNLGADTTICDGQSLVLDAGAGDTYDWSTGEMTQMITVTTSGTYSVVVTDTNGLTGTDTIMVTVAGTVTAAASVDSSGAPTYVFTDGSTNGTSWFWDFGDGNTSTDQNPTHTYSTPGTYTVTLIVSNPCGSDTITWTISAPVGVDEGFFGVVRIYPNPSNGIFTLELSEALQATVTDLNGRVIWSGAVSGRQTLDLSSAAAGMYLLRLEGKEGHTVRRLVIE